MNDLSQLEIALNYAKHGIAIFPCSANKAPATKNGFLDATTDVEQVTSWWTKTPDALIGHVCNERLVLDVDVYKYGQAAEIMMAHPLSVIEKMAENALQVETISGGRHYYFKNTNNTPRQIKKIAEVDILGVGGYSILPDGKSYTTDDAAPWETLSSLPAFDNSAFDDLVETSKVVSEGMKYIVRGMKLTNGSNTRPKKQDKDKKKKYNSDTQKYQEVEAELRDAGVDGINMGIINYETNRVEFKIERGMYKQSEKDFEKADHTVSLFADGKIVLTEGCLGTEEINQLFYNQEVQSKLADLIGLPTPKKGSTESLRSIFPEHQDEHRSMGVRWSKDGSHLIVRDFANYYGDTHQQVDYNLVRAYGVLRYNTNIPRLNGPEFNIWFLRMLYEADLIDISGLIQPIRSSTKLHETQKNVLESFQLLDALKRAYNGYDGTSTFADKFSSAWCQLTPSTVNRAKKALVKNGYLEIAGIFDCSGGKRDDGFFNTKLYRIPSSAQQNGENDKTTGVKTKMKLNEAVSLSSGVVADDAEKQTQARYPDLGTIVTLRVDEKDQDEIENFTIDFNIPNMPDYENIFVPLFVSDSYEIIDIEQENKTYVMDNFVLEILENEDGTKALAAMGKCPPIQKLIKKLSGETETSLIEEAEPYFIISSDIEDSELDLDEMTIRFNEYVSGRVTLTSIDVYYMHTDAIAAKLNGEDYEE